MKHFKAKTPLKRKLPKADEIEKSLEAIYEENGTLPDFANFEKKRRPYAWLIFFGVCTFFSLLIAAIWFGFMLFKPFRGFDGDGLRIEIDGPQKISLGEEGTYFINWQNMANEPLSNVELRINFPSDFVMTQVEPRSNDEKQLIFSLKDVPFGGRGSIVIRGMFTGSLGTKTAIQVVGNYRPVHSNADLEALSTRAIEYADSVLDGRLDVPAKALPGDKVRFVYTIVNRGSTTLKDMEARLYLPSGFIRDAMPTSTLISIEGDTVRVPLTEFIAGASTTVAVTGTFASGFSGDAQLRAETGRLSAMGVFMPAQTSDGSLSVLAGDLSMKLVVNGSDIDHTVPYGEVQHVSLAFENTSSEELKDVSITLFFDGSVTGTNSVDWSKLEQSSSGTHIGNRIVWDKQSNPVFEKMNPQADGILEFSVPLISLASSTTDQLELRLIAEAQMTLGNTTIRRIIRTKPHKLRFRSDVVLVSEARYSSEEGAPIGSGPLPPIVGQTTRYRINWLLDKSVHELKNIRVSAELPKRVEWAGVASTTAGELSYDSEKRVILWTLNRMPKDITEESVSFDIAFTPGEVDLSRFGQLLGETRLEAMDVDISEPLVQIRPRLSTDLPKDESAKSKGVVNKP
ncbi:hypothetical protein IT408_04155 [Candidatus Uhrbacteria bacterium]|nr:hypothetical protein [Candidatus Uhrbacteria bacterium]